MLVGYVNAEGPPQTYSSAASETGSKGMVRVCFNRRNRGLFGVTIVGRMREHSSSSNKGGEFERKE